HAARFRRTQRRWRAAARAPHPAHARFRHRRHRTRLAARRAHRRDRALDPQPRQPQRYRSRQTHPRHRPLTPVCDRAERAQGPSQPGCARPRPCGPAFVPPWRRGSTSHTRTEIAFHRWHAKSEYSPKVLTGLTLQFQISSTTLSARRPSCQRRYHTSAHAGNMLKASGFLCLLIGAFAATVHAQESVLKGPTCEACTISVTHVVTLGDNDRGLVGPQFVGLRDARGRYWISHPQSGDEVVVFDARGRYVHTFGRAGEGPGEFRRIRQMALGGDDVYLFDPRLARATVVSPDFELKRTVKVVGDPQNVEVLPSGKMVINTSVPTRERAGFMLHLLDTEGEIERSFAEVDSVFRLDYGLVGRRQLAMASEPGQVWVLPATEYVIQKWTTAGRMVEQLRRRVDWFEPHDLEIMPHPETPPAPVIWGVEED